MACNISQVDEHVSSLKCRNMSKIVSKSTAGEIGAETIKRRDGCG